MEHKGMFLHVTITILYTTFLLYGGRVCVDINFISIRVPLPAHLCDTWLKRISLFFSSSTSYSMVCTANEYCLCNFIQAFPKKKKRERPIKVSIKEFSGSLVKCNKNIFVCVENDK